jgi:hypothetical protein
MRERSKGLAKTSKPSRKSAVSVWFAPETSSNVSRIPGIDPPTGKYLPGLEVLGYYSQVPAHP